MIEKKIKCINSNTVHNFHKKQSKNNKLLGLWLYLMSDCIMFSVLFAVYVVAHSSSSFHFSYKILNLFDVFLETIVLLLSSLSCGMIVISAKQKNTIMIFVYLIITFILGICFITMEINEFYKLIVNDLGPNQNALLSSFFSLVGIHGAHVVLGLIFMLFIFFQTIISGVTNSVHTRILCLSLFWHFLDIIWICVFTFVYLNEAIL
ncbi:cytochrome o ubiquinol oxidase subunit III [Buchnera aphidicola (Muscaphis stroyani)]|uniref:Cytochrome bo(3) ubiquinol oxidase subunit 3 n=1 Tax=Buchnera aphidicola (Muscaphis stroyani) TaxID=1241869 RepID=A0A4D6YFG2_9GAMM|nr:cytochrome c oxidase subunit 3 [Buchnera aphidicola]QCI24508.1 cytochrome o ubiquinol oxidase subunit III [Buchnera aphidicola (Muscaphis stroyani)]